MGGFNALAAQGQAGAIESGQDLANNGPSCCLRMKGLVMPEMIVYAVAGTPETRHCVPRALIRCG
jgi:hypothetical protein